MKSMILLPLLLVLWSCNQSEEESRVQVDTQAEGEKLMELSREWSRSAATDSVEKTLSYWADDAVVMAPGEKPIRGKDSIRAMVENLSQVPGFKISWEPQSVTVSKSGDMAYMIEQNQITVNDEKGNPVTSTNKVVSVWRKENDGSWKNVVDMWNANPAEAQ